MSDMERVQAYAAEHPRAGRETVAKALKLTQYRAQSCLEQIRGKPKSPTRGVSAEAFLGGLDYAAQVQAALAEIGDVFILDADFRVQTEIPAIAWRRVADSGEFDDHQMKHGGKVYWGSKANVKRAKALQEQYR